jgi:release factor glutamine methyltransferase
MPGPRRVEQLIDTATRVLEDSTHLFEDHDNRAEAETLMAFVLDIEEDDIDPDEELDARRRDRFLALAARRAAGEPLPMLTGRIVFYGLELAVTDGAFVPRPSSELLVDRALHRLGRRSAPIVVDVCTGSGPIAMAIADEAPKAEVWGTDIDRRGLAQARRNASALDIDNVTFKRGDMYGGLPDRLRGRVDVITGHVPYVPLDEIDDLPSEVREHEPLFTLSDESGDEWGLLKRAIYGSIEWLRPGGWLLLEVSDDVTDVVAGFAKDTGLKDHGARTDSDELSYIAEARKP